VRTGRKVIQFSHFSFQVMSVVFLRNFKEATDVIQPSSTWKVEVEGAGNAAASASTFNY